jgi:hypothetical protein
MNVKATMDNVVAVGVQRGREARTTAMTRDAHPAEVFRNRRAVEAREIAAKLRGLLEQVTAELLLDYDRRLGGAGLEVATKYAAISRAALHVAGGDRPVPGPSLVAENKAKR